MKKAIGSIAIVLAVLVVEVVEDSNRQTEAMLRTHLQ
jgi:hypothetical protein